MTPRRLGHYVLEEELARGGMGVVYRARQAATGRPVALKLLLEERGGPTTRQRFAREAEALARVEHPGVVRLLEAGETPTGQAFLALELVEGRSLQDQLDRAGPLAPDEAVGRLLELCRAIEACHQAGVLHRDLKPDNLLLDANGALKVTDFGLARDVDPSLSRTQLSRSGFLMGTPGYWAPEQARGEVRAIGPATDVYGLGACLYALLTAQPPRSGESLVELLQAMDRPPLPPSQLNPRVSAALEAVVQRCLEHDPARRYASAAELEAALRGLARPAGRGGRRPAALAAGVLLLGGALAAALVGLGPRAAPPPPARGEPGAGRPASAEDWSALGRERAAAGDLTGAVEAFGRALALRPDDVDALLERAAALSQQRRPAALVAARADLSLVLALNPDEPRAWVQLGMLRATAGDLTGALEDYERALSRDPRSSAAWRNRAVALSGLGRLEEAVEAVSRAIECEPGSAAHWSQRAVLRAETGDEEGARRDVDRALELDPDHADSLFIRGHLRQQAADYAGSIADLDRAAALDPGNGKVLASRGVSRGRLGDLEGAIADFERALTLLPPESPDRDTVTSSLAKARRLLAGGSE